MKRNNFQCKIYRVKKLPIWEHIYADQKPCNSLAGVSLGNYFTPMIPKLSQEVQDTEHIIPEDSLQSWPRGGLPSRQIMKNND